MRDFKSLEKEADDLIEENNPFKNEIDRLLEEVIYTNVMNVITQIYFFEDTVHLNDDLCDKEKECENLKTELKTKEVRFESKLQNIEQERNDFDGQSSTLKEQRKYDKLSYEHACFDLENKT